MINGLTISVVIPCKNEEGSILNTIKSIPNYVDEIIVVDGGSTDKTLEIASETSATVLVDTRKIKGISYGYQILTGLNYARGDYLFTIDGDGSHPANVINKVLKLMVNKNLDVVSCSRLPLSDAIAISKIRKLGIYILNIEVFLLYGKKVTDILSGMFGIKSSILPQLNLKMGDWNLSPEIKISALVNKSLRYGEYPIKQIARATGESKQIIFDTGFSHFFYILKRRFMQDNPLFVWVTSAKAYLLRTLRAA